MIGYSKEEIVEKVQAIAADMDKKTEQARQLAENAKGLEASVLIDRGRLEELKNMYNMIIAKEEELAQKKEEELAQKKEEELAKKKEQPAPKKKAPAKARKK
jgi:hypothetical protein